LGRAVAGLNAQTKGRRLGIFKPHEQTQEAAQGMVAVADGDDLEMIGHNLSGSAQPIRRPNLNIEFFGANGEERWAEKLITCR
jgi:hypothetical protein